MSTATKGEICADRGAGLTMDHENFIRYGGDPGGLGDDVDGLRKPAGDGDNGDQYRPDQADGDAKGFVEIDPDAAG